MQWSEDAIILSCRKFGESNLLIEVFASSKGLYSGLVRGGQSKKQSATYQTGNIIEATWRGRLEEQLGMFTAEMNRAVVGSVIDDPLKLQALVGLTSLLRKALVERQPYSELYGYLKAFLENLGTDEKWLEHYALMEIALLQYMGFGLDLSQCAITGARDNLEYISPRTGRAATGIGARGYEEKLFALPRFLVNDEAPDAAQILATLKITGHFLDKNMFAPHNRQIPDERQRFVQMLNKSIKNQIELHEMA